MTALGNQAPALVVVVKIDAQALLQLEIILYGLLVEPVVFLRFVSSNRLPMFIYDSQLFLVCPTVPILGVGIHPSF